MRRRVGFRLRCQAPFRIVHEIGRKTWANDLRQQIIEGRVPGMLVVRASAVPDASTICVTRAFVSRV